MSADLAAVLRAGDQVLVASGAGEPLALTEDLLARCAELPDVRVLLGYTVTGTFDPARTLPALTVLGGYGTNRRLLDAGAADVVTCHHSALPGLIARGELRVDVLLAACSPAEGGEHSFGVTADVLTVAARGAREVVVEVDDRMPRTRGDTALPEELVTHSVHTNRSLPEQPGAAPTAAEHRIAERIAELVPNRAVLQLGVGRLPDATAALLRDHRDLGVHSGLLGDWVVDLVECGAVTNAAKPVDVGVTVGGLLVGTGKLYDWADNNPALSMRDTRYTHGAVTLSELDTLVTVNSAVEIDLTGQVNAETAGGRYVGAVGGQVDYVRAGAAAAMGRSILALPATSGARSRIVPQLTGGVVTTPRADVDTVVTEHGMAELRGKPLAERARLLAELAAPEHREALHRAAREVTATVR